MAVVPPGETCPKCHKEHNPKFCQAHAKRLGGQQCTRYPSYGLTVCPVHGGKIPAVQAKHREAVADREARKLLGKLTITPVVNPFTELQVLAGEAVAWKQVCADRVAELSSMRYSTDGGEAIRGEILLFERAIDRCASILGMIAKLNLDERMVVIAEAQKKMIILAIEAALKSAGIIGDQATEAKRVAARHLRAVNTEPHPPRAAGE